MKITGVRAITVGNPWKNWIFVIVETDEGITGLGEATEGLSTKPIEAALTESRAALPGPGSASGRGTLRSHV